MQMLRSLHYSLYYCLRECKLIRVMNSLGSGNLRLAVMLPEGEDLNEWLAVNSRSHPRLIDYAWKGDVLNLSYGLYSRRFLQSIKHARTPSYSSHILILRADEMKFECVVWMYYGILYERRMSRHVCRSEVRVSLARRSQFQETYQSFRTWYTQFPSYVSIRSCCWCRGDLRCTEYVDYLMDWVQKQLDDDAIFPSQPGTIHRYLTYPLTTMELIGGNHDVQAFHSLRISMRQWNPSWGDCSEFTHISTITTSRSFVLYPSKVRLTPLDLYVKYWWRGIWWCTAHINTSYRHFLLFVTEVRLSPSPPRCFVRADGECWDRLQFNLIEKKELAPLSELNESILSNQVPSK